MATGGPSTVPASFGGPKPAPSTIHSDAGAKERKDLTSWWKNFKRTDKKAPEPESPQGIFGVPLQISIRYANVAISLFNDEGQSYIYGYVPIVVAKCGVFLKEKATDIEGIFRLAGSEKRIKELKAAFDSPDRYGKGLDWTGYTVHDAANILRRYFNQLPEPIIPLDFYQQFREPLKDQTIQADGLLDVAQDPNDAHHAVAIRSYQRLITELPPLNRQLLLYILDLLAVFASKSDLNKMTTPNLAAIFQPGILSHPSHDMAPQEYVLSQNVLIFLIEHQDSFLIGMQGTAADAETVRDVQSGTPVKGPGTPTTPNRAKTIIGRSGSSSSAAADSVRKFGSIRRNMSVSSKHSRRSENGPTPVTPTQTTTSGGVHRSNTAPSRRHGSASQSPRLPRDKSSGSPTPSPGTPVGPAHAATSPHRGSLQSTPTATSAPGFPLGPPEVTSASSSEATTPLAQVDSTTSSAVAREYQTPKRDTTPLLAPPGGSAEKSAERQASNTSSASSDRKFFGILRQSPSSDGEGRKPNKLQKKRIPGSALSSAHSSNQSLHDEPKDVVYQPTSPRLAASTGTEAAVEKLPVGAATAAQPPTLPATPQRNATDATLRPTISPPHSFNSHTDDTSDADMVGDDMPPVAADATPREKKRGRWRLSRTTNKLEPSSSTTSDNPLGTMTAKEQTASRSTIGSGGSQPRMSFQEPTRLGPVTTDPAIVGAMPPPPAPTPGITPSTSDPVFSDSERERKGIFSRIRDRIQERKDIKEMEKRSRTPERGHGRSKSKQDLQLPAEALPVRGPSLEQQRPAVAAAPPPTASASGGAATTPLTLADSGVATTQEAKVGDVGGKSVGNGGGHEAPERPVIG